MVQDMAKLTMLSFCFFIIAKVLGILGVILGFGAGTIHVLGGYVLIFAFIAITISITFAIVQLRREKHEDELALSSKG